MSDCSERKEGKNIIKDIKKSTTLTIRVNNNCHIKLFKKRLLARRREKNGEANKQQNQHQTTYPQDPTQQQTGGKQVLEMSRVETKEKKTYFLL